MYPILFQFGPITLYTYGVVVLAGFLIAMALVNALVTKAGLRIAFITDYLLSLLFVTIAAGRLLHVVLKWGLFQHNMIEVFFIWRGGISTVGALIGGITYFAYLCLRHHQRFLLWMDAITVPLSTLLGFWYLGFFLSDQGLSGKALGTPTTLPWGMNIDYLNAPYIGTPVHPVGLYMITALLGSAIGILILQKKKPHLKTGISFFAWLSIFALALITTESLKWDIDYIVLGMNVYFVIGIALLLFGLGGLWYRSFNGKTPRLHSTTAHAPTA